MITNGSDVLLAILDKCVGHCSEHVCNYTTETKDRAVKAPETEVAAASFFKEVSVTGLKISITAKGLMADDETELAADRIRDAWRQGLPVAAQCFPRRKTAADAARKPYLKAKFIITKLTENYPADDDANFDLELQMTGAPEVWETPGE